MKRLLFLLALALLTFSVAATQVLNWEPDQRDREREVITVTIGSGDQQALIPVNMYYRTSLFETIYLASEMNASGQITAIRFYNNFLSNLPAKPTQVWLGETPLADLSNGWIPASQLTQVFSGNVDYPAGMNEITITLGTPFAYGGGNLVMMVFRPWDDEYYISMDSFYAQTVGSNRSLNTFNHNTPINPDNPPTTGVTGQFPKTTFFVDVTGTGALAGYVAGSGSPLADAVVSIANTNFTQTTGADGSYSFPYVPAGTYQVEAAKTGYTTVSHTLTIVAGQTATQDFALAPLDQITVSGRIVGSDAPDGLAGAQIELSGYAQFSATTDGSGDFSIPGVFANQTYNYNIGASGYQNATGSINVGATDYSMGTLILNEIAYPPQNVVAESVYGNSVNLAWEEPNAALEGWLHYDSGENNTSFGTSGSLSFEVAVRFPPDSLAAYAGGFLQAVKIWPAQGGNFSVRVWTGGDASAPGMMVVDQPIIPVLNSYNTVLLDFPVPITGTEELWFGFLCDVTGVNPAYAGVDYGPAVDGFGNMIHWQGNWTTLLSVNAYCDFNWNIQGYVGLNPPSAVRAFAPLAVTEPGPERVTAYQVWRFLQGQANNESLWVSLTPNPITATTFTDTGWYAVPDGTYYWAVKSVYINGLLSDPAFSNPLTKVTQVGTIAGIVRNQQNAPIMDATVSCGDVTATTNSSGAYSMLVESGTHSVTASHPEYHSVTQDGVVVSTGQTTTLNFQLPLQTNDWFFDGFDSYANFALEFAPWTLVDVDLSSTYGMTGITWPNANAAMAYMIFVPSATTPPVTDADPHGGIKQAACFASTTPPNNDWLITPVLNNPGQISFWARSYTADYGLERFKVGVSTTGTYPAEFTIISGTDYLQAPVDWTEYTFDVSIFTGNVYIGIQCVSNDAFIFFVDDVVVNADPVDDQSIPVIATELHGNYPNPFNPETTIRYSVKETSPVTLEIYNVKGQVVKTLVSEAKASGHYTATWNGRDNNNQPVSSGVYFYKMRAGKYSNTKKMILIK